MSRAKPRRRGLRPPEKDMADRLGFAPTRPRERDRHHRFVDEPTPLDRRREQAKKISRVPAPDRSPPLPRPAPDHLVTVQGVQPVVNVPAPVLTAEENKIRKKSLNRLATTHPKTHNQHAADRFGPEKAEAISRRWARKGG
jgi:hypothetical protein